MDGSLDGLMNNSDAVVLLETNGKLKWRVLGREIEQGEISAALWDFESRGVVDSDQLGERSLF